MTAIEPAEEAPEYETAKGQADVDQVDGICNGEGIQTELRYLP